jgi:hypothetical protein
MTHSTDKSYYVNSDILSVLSGDYHNNNFVTHAFFSPGFSTDSFGYSHDYKKGMQPEGAAGPEALHILTRKGTTDSNFFLSMRKGASFSDYPRSAVLGNFFMLQKGVKSEHYRIKRGRCAKNRHITEYNRKVNSLFVSSPGEPTRGV